MAKQERYTIGPNLLRDIRSTIQKVDAMAPATSGPTQGVRYWDMQRPTSRRTDVFKICTFTGAWAIDAQKTLTFKYQTSTPNTVVATNVLMPIPDSNDLNFVPVVWTCAIGKDGTAWHLINVNHQNMTALSSVTLTPTHLQFGRRDVLAVQFASSTVGISVAACDTAQASAQATSYFQ